MLIMWKQTIIILLTVIFCVSFTEAITNLHLVEQSSIEARTYFEEGVRQVKRRNYRGAIRAFRSTVQYDPKLAEAYLNIGACYERLNLIEKGIPYFEKALSVDSNNPRLHYLYGAALGRNNKLSACISHLERAVYLEPDNPDYLYNLGVGYVSVTQYANAAICFEQVTGIVSNNGIVWYNLGLAKYRMYHTNEAVEAWKQVEIDSPVAAEAQYHLALAAFNNNDDKTAMETIKMATALKQNMPEAEHLKARILRRSGQYNKAISLLEKIHLQQTDNILDVERELAEFYIEWAKAAVANKEYKTALNYFRQSGRYAPSDADIQIYIAQTALQANEYVVVNEALERALRYAKTPEQEKKINEIKKELVIKREKTNER